MSGVNLDAVVHTYYNVLMPYNYEDTNYWVEKVLPIQLQTKRFVTVDQCREAWGLRGKSAAHNRLKELVRQGKAERVQVGERWHYHIYEVKR